MGLGGISIWQLLIILVIVLLIFGTKRLKTVGGDLGGAIKSFRKAMENDEDKGARDRKDETKQLASSEEPDAEFPEQKERSRNS